MKIKRNRAVFLLFFLIAGILFNVFKPQERPVSLAVSVMEKSVQTARVIRVIDGDTIVIEGGKVVRYTGMDAPETKHPKKEIECFGKQAAQKNTELVLGKEVRLEKDVSETDKYKRLLRYVFVGDTFVNDYLVREGFAHVASFPPDVKYQDQFIQAQQEAQSNERGLWGKDKENCQ